MEQEISETVDKWIKEEQISKPIFLRVVRANDPWEGMSEEEIEDSKEFIRWYLNKDFVLLLQIPVNSSETDFWVSSYEEFAGSAFNTHDFEALHRPFNKYGYRINKIMERVKDLAVIYSCLTSLDGREDILAKYESLVNREFRDNLMNLVERYRVSDDYYEKMLLKAKIAKLSQHILKCKAMWQKYSVWE